ncbi:5,6-dimethylbenzimidazole synthase [Candidatus Nitrosocaldus cavascurensis]|jgi:5,6-dimethylbenzimidazole synthase|uniref:5,6-dimethylbenzimidazole synthase n=2 Tax=Candidatus Nitrosocaldaceae TaxID=1968910 RepID=A0A2K5AT56_9ARCH|nr:5,6-dimethylbenzimidazole synthase [Candidatus Nitrosocaldus cavascurensis]
MIIINRPASISMDDDFLPEEKRGVYKAIYSRRDVRAHFLPKEIPDDVLFRILDAAHHAPSVGFSQPWNFIIIRDKGIKARVKELFMQEFERSSSMIEDEQRKKKYLSLKLEGIMEAPVNICVTYDPNRFGPFIIGKSSIPETGLYSVCCAIQNLWLAARAEGIGVGWVSILSNDKLKEVLRIPEGIVPIAYLCLGYVTHFESIPDLERAGWLSRLPLEDVLYFEQWGNK